MWTIVISGEKRRPLEHLVWFSSVCVSGPRLPRWRSCGSSRNPPHGEGTRDKALKTSALEANPQWIKIWYQELYGAAVNMSRNHLSENLKPVPCSQIAGNNLVPRVLSYPPYGARRVGQVGENPGNEVEQGSREKITRKQHENKVTDAGWRWVVNRLRCLLSPQTPACFSHQF